MSKRRKTPARSSSGRFLPAKRAPSRPSCPSTPRKRRRKQTFCARARDYCPKRSKPERAQSMRVGIAKPRDEVSMFLIGGIVALFSWAMNTPLTENERKLKGGVINTRSPQAPELPAEAQKAKG